MPASPIRKLTPFADEAKARGVRVLHLNIGQPDLETPPQLRARLSEIRDRVFEYTPSVGTPEYLAMLLLYYQRLGIELKLNQILATTGGSEALLFAMLACSDEGGEAIVVEPFYTNYTSFATMAGVRLVPITARGEDGFHLPPRDQWDKAVSPRSRFVLLCNPNNPTGTVYRREELESIVEFCRDHGLFLIVDEVYREFVYDGRTPLSALQLPRTEETVIVIDSLSKRYSACGIRLGCLVTRNPQIYDACVRMAQARLSPPGLAQMIAPGVSRLGPQYLAAVVAEFQKRRDLLYEELQGVSGVFLRKPEGAFYFVARLPVVNSEEFARWMLTDFQREGTTVMLAPASGFYATPGLGVDEVRIAYVLNEQALRAAVATIREALDQYFRVRGVQRERREAPRPAGQPDFSIPTE
jgi:aspartate aminotransferase